MSRSFLPPFLFACAFLSLPVKAATPEDVEGSHDYPGWTRMPGFEITDYDEDNPAAFTFSISKPTAADADHLEGVPIQGHRYVIQYDWSNTGKAPSVSKSQRYFEKLATNAGYKVEKKGSTGNWNETFHLTKDGREIWVYFSPAGRTFALTVVESKAAAVAQQPATTTTTVTSTANGIPAPGVISPSPQTSLTPPANIAPTGTEEDPLATELIKNGRVVLPLNFLPGKPDLASDSKPVIARVVAILKLHPDLALTIEGHTDLTGDEDYNVLLSKQRAQAVRTALMDGHISRKRLTAVGLGGTVPIADEGTAEGRQKNRRIELVVRKDSDKTSEPTKKDVGQTNASAPRDPATSATDDFHSPAPDGVNYYPDASKIQAPPPPAGLKSMH
jgi:outer membrane protein OmpA-like peptidoglycan-associated protein